ncbi:MAG: DUF4911 domain-containing protein [Oligoflexia bacterium]|nr:DUF4911 domain-containing protein [Oligoflexia bacterium]
MRKEDSVFVYWVLESHEGVVSYSTLDFVAGDPHRDLELRIPPGFEEEVDGLLNRLGDQDVVIYRLP